MKFAYVDGKRISIDEYTDDLKGKILCAYDHSLIAKRGEVKAHHFAHKSKVECLCSNNKGTWHEWWQDRASNECQEIRVKGTTRYHIADTLITKGIECNTKGYVIEYQHSPMNTSVMRKRETFYTQKGYTLVWVFDTNTWNYSVIKRNGRSIKLRKMNGSEFPLNAEYKGPVLKILDFGKKDLLLVTKQRGKMIEGILLSFKEFDQTYIGTNLGKVRDERIFHHEI